MANDMGLGKGISVLAVLLAEEVAQGRPELGNLIVVTLTVRLCLLNISQSDTRTTTNGAHIVLTTYETIANEIESKPAFRKSKVLEVKW